MKLQTVNAGVATRQRAGRSECPTAFASAYGNQDLLLTGHDHLQRVRLAAAVGSSDVRGLCAKPLCCCAGSTAMLQDLLLMKQLGPHLTNLTKTNLPFTVPFWRAHSDGARLPIDIADKPGAGAVCEDLVGGYMP